VRHPITNNLAAAFGNNRQPIAGVFLKAIALERIDLIAADSE
jgi:hypothetical protein